MSQLFTLPQAVRIDSTGAPYAGAKIHFYLTGTTTDTNTYTDSARTTPHANPVVAGADGQFAPIYLAPTITYRAYIVQSDDTLIKDVDPIGTPLTSSDIAVVDTAGYYAGTEVETVLADLGLNYAKKSVANTWSADQTFSAANLQMADNIIQRPTLKDFGITHNDLTQSTGTVTCDMSTGSSFYFLLTENATIAITNPPPTGTLGQLVIRIKQDGAAGAYTVAWPAGVVWAGGSSPVMTTSNDAYGKFTLMTDDAGTSYYGEFGLAYAAA